MHPKIPMDVTLINLQMEDNISVKEMDIPHQRQGPKEENLSYNWLPAGQGWKLEGGEREGGAASWAFMNIIPNIWPKLIRYLLDTEKFGKPNTLSEQTSNGTFSISKKPSSKSGHLSTSRENYLKIQNKKACVQSMKQPATTLCPCPSSHSILAISLKDGKTFSGGNI